jgi:hypothetical protein
MVMTAAIGGIGLAGAGIAQACDGEQPPHTAIDNAQSLECEQEFTSSSLLTVSVPISVLGESVSNVGNFCTLVGSRH